MTSKLAIVVLSFVIIVVGVWKLTPPKVAAEPESEHGTLQHDQLLQLMNAARKGADAATPLLRWDESVQAWAEKQIRTTPTDSAESAAEQILSAMQAEVDGIAAAAAGIFRAPMRQDAFSSEFASWAELSDASYSHGAIVFRPHEDGNVVDVWALLTQRLPDFSPDLLGQGLQQFHHLCARCDRTYNGQFYGGERVLLLTCPHCEHNYDILAVNTSGRYQRANSFFSHLNPLGVFPKEMTPQEELRTIWGHVLGHCRYENDYDVRSVGSARDSWQTSAQTLQRRTGDCEDTSILLADWLISRGIQARVVIGKTDSLQGHAWCVARIEDDVYLLETTGEAKDLQRYPPLAEQVADRYRPEYLFDREHLYFFKGDPKLGPGDSWDANLWEAVPYTSEPEVADSPTSEAPWFSSATATSSSLGWESSARAPSAN